MASAYEQGFLDALALMEYYLEKNRLLDEKILKILKGVRKALYEKRVENIKMQLGLL